ncbi:MAG TPA: hypothetical protein VMM76_23860 [Pirellulaceae bacterium]|nr:hypothetical protein [Pirellulaceae bacterium]
MRDRPCSDLVDRPDIRERLHYYAAEFEKLKDAAEPLPQAQEENVEIAAAQFDRPIWAYGLNDLKWMFASESNRDTSVMFVSLANRSVS